MKSSRSIVGQRHRFCSAARVTSAISPSRTRSTVIVRLIVICISVSGFVYQMYNMCSEYYQYKTLTRTDRSLPSKYAAPNVALCFPFEQLINQSEYLRMKGSPLPKTLPKPFERTQDLPNVTIREMFHLTPPISRNFFSYCTFRQLNSYDSLRGSGQYCLDHLMAVNKFYTQEFICYNIRPLTKDKFSYSRLADSLVSGGLIYAFSLNKNIFSMMDRVKIILYHGYLPQLSKACAPMIKQRTVHTASGKGGPSYISLTAATTQINQLMRPYESGCVAGRYRFETCWSQCLIKHIAEKLARVPFSYVIDDEPTSLNGKYVNYTFVNLSDLQDVRISGELFAREESCEARCKNMNCQISFSSTEAIVTGDPAFASLTYTINAPRRSYIVIHFVPHMRLIEFLVLISSCLGFWFGFSVLSLEPLNLLGRWRVQLAYAKQCAFSKGMTGPLSTENMFNHSNRTASRFYMSREAYRRQSSQ